MHLKEALIVCPTLNPGRYFSSWSRAVLDAGIDPQNVLIVDSESSEPVEKWVQACGFRFMSVPREQFDHGATRQLAVDQAPGFPVYIMVSQDSIIHGDALDEVIKPFADENVGAVYGRQLPRELAGPVEEHGRLFSYTEQSRVSSLEDRAGMGMKVAFLSNAFTAYRAEALSKAGGFPRRAICSEDMYVGARLLLDGWKLAYAAEAKTNHSHGYSINEEFSRYFDIGVFHARESWIRRELGAAEGEGMRYLRSETGYLLRHAWYRLPEALLRTLAKYSGYRLGLMENTLPRWLKRKLAMNPVFFR